MLKYYEQIGYFILLMTIFKNIIGSRFKTSKLLNKNFRVVAILIMYFNECLVEKIKYYKR